MQELGKGRRWVARARVVRAQKGLSWAAQSWPTVGPGRGGLVAMLVGQKGQVGTGCWWERKQIGKGNEGKEREKRRKEKKKKRKRGSGLFEFENPNLYPSKFLNFQLRFFRNFNRDFFLDKYDINMNFRFNNSKYRT